MTGFLSALGGFAKGLDQSLQRNEAYAQQAKAAKEAREEQFLIDTSKMRYKQQLESGTKVPEGFSRYPGSEYLLPINVGVKDDSRLNSQYILKFWNGKLNEMSDEEAAAFVKRPAWRAATSTHLSQAFQPRVVKGEGDAIKEQIVWNPIGHFTNRHLLQFTEQGGFRVGYANVPDINPTDNTFQISLDSNSMNPQNAEFQDNKLLVDALHGDGEYEKLVRKYRSSSDSEDHTVILQTDIKQVKIPGTDILTGVGGSFNYLWRGLSTKNQILYGRNPQVAQFFDKRYPFLSKAFEDYMVSENNTPSRVKAAGQMISLLELDEFGKQNPDLVRGIVYLTDKYLQITDAVALALTKEKRVQSGDTVTIYPANTVRLEAAIKSKLLDQKNLWTQSIDQINDVQTLLVNLNKLDKAGAHFPLKLANFFNTLFGASGPREEGDNRPKAVVGILEGIVNVIDDLIKTNDDVKAINSAAGVSSKDVTGLKVWGEKTINSLKNEGRYVESLYNRNRAAIDKFTIAQEKLGTVEQAMAYWQDNSKISPEERVAVQEFYLAAAKAELTYKLAMTWQGGAGGRAVSDYDFKIIRAAIWSSPSAEAQAHVLNYIKMSSIRPLLRNEILLRYDGREGINPYKILTDAEPILQVAYRRAVAPYYELGIDEKESVAKYDEKFKFDLSPEETGFSRFAPYQPTTKSLESLRVL